ncbi:hypothetical protein ES703_29319 [subsurface metagenome]
MNKSQKRLKMMASVIKIFVTGLKSVFFNDLVIFNFSSLSIRLTTKLELGDDSFFI